MWKRIVSGYELRPDEAFMLETACQIADTSALLDAAMVGQPLVTKGSMGQEREHPILSEARQQRALLVRTLAALRLPDEATAPRTRSTKARDAAFERWQPQAHTRRTS
jgi:hypothetical protein